MHNVEKLYKARKTSIKNQSLTNMFLKFLPTQKGNDSSQHLQLIFFLALL